MTLETAIKLSNQASRFGSVFIKAEDQKRFSFNTNMGVVFFDSTVITNKKTSRVRFVYESGLVLTSSDVKKLTNAQ
jgi:hypothetical protein